MLLTLEEVADFLHVHPSIVYRLLKNRRIPAFRMGSDWRFNQESSNSGSRDSKTGKLLCSLRLRLDSRRSPRLAVSSPTIGGNSERPDGVPILDRRNADRRNARFARVSCCDSQLRLRGLTFQAIGKELGIGRPSPITTEKR